MKKIREYNLDYLRILACIMVVCVHVSAQNWYSISVKSSSWKIFNIYDTMVRSAVPLFFMMSGKLFLSREKINVRKLYTDNLRNLVCIYFLWSLFYAIDSIGLHNFISDFNVTKVLRVVLESKYHLWYLPALISVYLLIPIFMALKEHQNGLYLNYICVFFIVFTVIRKSILALPIDSNLTLLLNKFQFALDGYCGYFLLGYLLDKYKYKLLKIRNSVLILGYTITVMLTAIATYKQSILVGKASDVFYNYFFLSTFLEAIFIFVIFLRIPSEIKNEKVAWVIRKVSKYTLFVYLMHLFVLEHLDKWYGMNTMSFHAVISIPAITILVFVICVVIALVLDQVPYIRKIL